MHRYLLILLTMLLLCPNLHAQDKEYLYEIGVGAGSAWGYGDGNHGETLGKQALQLDALFRYNVNLRWALAFDGSTNQVFDDRLWSMAFRPEFSFWNFGWGSDYREKHHVAPFLTAGIGLGGTTGSHSDFSCMVPLGLGLKWKIAPRWSAQATALFSKYFSDRTDGIYDPQQVGTRPPMNTDWVGSITLSLTFDFKERCIECKNQNSF